MTVRGKKQKNVATDVATSQVKSWAMDQEDEFYEIAIREANNHIDYQTFETHMVDTYGDLIYSDVEEVIHNLSFIFGGKTVEVGHA